MEALREALGNAAMARMLDQRTTDEIESQLGGGKPLDAQAPAAEDGAEDGHGAAAPRIHDDAKAAELSANLGAVAFTFGRDIFLAGDAPALASDAGQRMLRHELTHVRQHEATGATRPTRVSSPSSPAEREAGRAADGGQAAAGSAASNAVHRQSDLEEEEVAMMPAETVHRQTELEEEEVMTMPGETVHRQGAEEVDEAVAGEESGVIQLEEVVIESREMANPALAALFDTTVIAKVDQALQHMEVEPPEAEDALRAISDATDAMDALTGTYRETDPLLSANLHAARNGAIGLITAIQPVAGYGPDVDWIRRNLGTLIGRLHEITPTLH